jgi:hypothetical protein
MLVFGRVLWRTHECQFNQSENMQRLRDALEEPARSSVEMLLLADDAERVMAEFYGEHTSVNSTSLKKCNAYVML